MNEEPYKNREIREMFTDVEKALQRIEMQTTKTNGRVSRLEQAILILGTALTVILLMNGSELAKFFSTLVL